MAKTDITPEGMEAQIQQEAPKAATQPAAKKSTRKSPKVLCPKNGPTITVTKNW